MPVGSPLPKRVVPFIFRALLLWAGVSAGGSSRAADLYVAPSGNDAWSGTVPVPNPARTDGPLASLEGARARLQQSKPIRPTRVIVAGGTYALTRSLVFEPADTGTKSAPISYEAAAGARPVFTGGRSIGHWQGPDAKGVWTTQIAEVAKWRFEQLWVNGRLATRAVSPNPVHYSFARGPVRPTLQNGDPTTLQGRAFKADPADLAPLLQLSAAELRDVVVNNYETWTSTQYRVDRIDPATNTVYLQDDQWPVDRYTFENFAAALDAPGEWFLDRAGTLSYLPRPGEDMSKVSCIAPTIDHFIEINGKPDEGRFVDYLTFRGLSFQHAQYLLPPKGYADGQAEAKITAAIIADGARHVSFESCDVAHAGTCGIWLRRGCREDRIVHCRLEDLGAGGVKLGDWEVPANEPAQTRHLTVDNNIMHRLGRINHAADGVWIGHSSDNVVTHNDIADLYETGISAGWIWGYGESLAKRNTIAFNHIHHLGQGVLSDMGGVYLLGLSEGTTVTNNVIHDVYGYSYGAWGLYTDEGASFTKIENNLVYDTRSGSFHQHFGKENLVRNNIFAFAKYGPPNPERWKGDFANSPEAQLVRTRDENVLGFTFDNNIIYWSGGELFKGHWTEHLKFHNNVFWDTARSHDAKSDAMALYPWKIASGDQGSIFANPLFVQAEARNFALQPESPALKHGFKPFDPALAGVYGEPAWVAEARNDPMPALQLTGDRPASPPLQLNEDFETMLLGVAPENATVFVEKRQDSIGASDDAAVSGQRSLKMQDAAGLTNRFDPHFFFAPHHAEGLTQGSFDVRVDAGAVFLHEWRTGDKPYETGPAIRIGGGKLESNGKQLLEVPTGKWLHIAMSAQLGRKANSKWNLAVTLPDQPVQHFDNLDCASAKFAGLEWYGFMSDANGPSVIYLDNLKLTNDAPPPTPQP